MTYSTGVFTVGSMFGLAYFSLYSILLNMTSNFLTTDYFIPLFGIDVNPEQSKNALRPMLVTLLGMVFDVNPVQ